MIKLTLTFDFSKFEILHINWRKPTLNAQQNDLAITLSLQLLSPLVVFCLCLFVCFCFFFSSLFHLLFSLSLTLIIGIFYYLNYASLLLYLIITHLVSHLSLSSIIFIISTLIIGIFYCLITFRYYLSHYNTPCNRFYNNNVTNIYPKQLLWFI